MAFKLANKRSVIWPVKVHIPQDGGTSRVETFSCNFEILEQSELDKRLADQQDARFLASIILDWDGVMDEQGQSLDCTDETKAMLLEILYVRNGVMKAYFDALNGGRSKN